MAENLAAILPEAQALGVAIYISDDSPDTATQAVVDAATAGHPEIHYRRNVPALRHDANLIATLAWPDADYIWLIGDKMHPAPGILQELLRFLDDQDLIFVNAHSDDYRMIPAVVGAAARALTRDALWHQTLTGATIYSRVVCDHAPRIRIWSNFPQISTILDRTSSDPVTVGWFGKRSLIVAASSGESYWRSRMVEVFAHDWAAVVTAFPKTVPPAERTGVIRAHSRRMNLFTSQALLALKSSGQFTPAVLRQRWFRQAMHLPFWKLLVLLLPDAGLDALRKARAGLRTGRW
jgi:hypothetical protein